MIPILLRALGFVLTTAGGWAISDIFNEHQRTKQQDAKVTIVESAKATVKSNSSKWLFLAAGLGIAFILFAVLKPIIMGKRRKQEAIL